MDTKQAAAQRDEQQDATLESAIRTHVRAAIMDTHTCLPGIIKKFYPETQTATVQPAIQQIFVEQGAVSLPLCVDVPVQFPSGGNFVLTFPVEPEDECLLVFSERAIDFWWDRGRVQLPSEYRLHDLSDAFAIVGVSSKPRKLPAFSTTGVELRTRDGSAPPLRLARMGDTAKLTLLPADVAALASALLATGAFVPSGTAPTPPPAPTVLTGGEITGGSSSVKAV